LSGNGDLVAKAGRIDISFNAMGNSPAGYLGASLVDMAFGGKTHAPE
jgi:hypothetical protein